MDKDVRLLLAHVLRWLAVALLATIWLCESTTAAQTRKRGVAITAKPNGKPIAVVGQLAQRWQDDSEDVVVLRGNCQATNGDITVSGQQLVVWTRKNDSGDNEVTVYGEQARVQGPGSLRSEPAVVVAFRSTAKVNQQVTRTLQEPARHDPLFQRAMRYRRNTSPKPASVPATPLPATKDDVFAAWQPALPQARRRVEIRPRTSQPLSFFSRPSTDTIPAEQIAEITGGVNIVIDGFTTTVNGQEVSLGPIALSADRVVIWSAPGDDLRAGKFEQAKDTPFQVYMEGNIEIRQGGNIMTATHGFFDVQSDRALLMNGELRGYLPNTDGQVRVRAERIRQDARNRFHAQNAWVTTSPYGKPGYRLEASDIFVESRPNPWIGDRRRGPQNGVAANESLWITSLNNRFVIGDTPILSFPKFSGPAEDPGVPLRRGSVRHDNVFGLQVKTVWDLTQLLGMEKRPGLDWNLNADYLSDRGPGVGTSAEYNGVNPAGLSYRGEGLLYYIYDGGTDNLGRDRRNLTTSNNRGRALWRHRQELPNNVKLFGEIGYVSDRNFVEQYYEPEFDRGKDQETSLRIKQDIGAFSAQLWARPQLNDFETTTEWLPRLDTYGLSYPLLGGAITWSHHNSIGYARLRPADAPSDTTDVFSSLPYVASAQGLVTMTRHEIDAPFNIGAVKITPFAMGELAYWEEGFSNNEISRSLFSAGVRASLVESRIFPFVRWPIFNVNGLAHKIERNLEARITEADQDLSDIPQYNEIDDNAQERFRYRLFGNTFGGMLPGQFNPRSFAIRQGAGNSVAAPYHELIDDQQVIRYSVRHRLQTKVGPATNPRTRDWLTWESGFSYFPKADRDNFGEDLGLFYSRYQWHIGERTSVIANTLWDVFDGGQRVSNVGLLSQRSKRGSVYVGYRSVNGTAALDSDIVTASLSYAMSPKWAMTAGTAYDFGEGRDRGQSFMLSRIGLDWIFHMGANYDASKDNVGFALMFEPRFGSSSSSPVQLNSLLGVR